MFKKEHWWLLLLSHCHVPLFAASWTVARQASLSFTLSPSLLKLMSIELVMPSNHLILCHLLLLPSVFLSIRVFSSESALHIRWPEYWSFSFRISPSKEYSGLISLRIDWFTLLAVQGTLKSLFQHHSLKINSLALSLLYGITLKSIFNYWKKFDYTTLTIWIIIGKIMSLLFNTLFSFGIAFLPKSKCLLISWLQSASTVILEPKKIKSVTVSIISTSIYHEVIGPDAMILVFWMLTFKPAFSLSSFTFTKQLFSSSLASAIRVVSSAYLRLLIFLLAILIPAWASINLAFHTVNSADKLNKQGDNIQP